MPFRGRGGAGGGGVPGALLDHAKLFWVSEEKIASELSARQRMLVTTILVVIGLILAKTEWLALVFDFHWGPVDWREQIADNCEVLAGVYLVLAFMLATGTVKGRATASVELMFPDEVANRPTDTSERNAVSLTFSRTYGAAIVLNEKNRSMRDRLAAAGAEFGLSLVSAAIATIMSMM